MSEPTKPCVLCEKALESVNEDWIHYQPYGGCEVQIIGSYGSTKFDHHIGSTVFRGVICDDCAEKIIHRLEEQKTA